ncbi:hypothetical protein IW261DRAFT_1420743 [Armillaria novae-zelandiae]|uniref:Uncharacterized protein n=1 Tax=Armillaria novae-zelandiae TaxID=153914 RepID=A0AA39U9A6_9AGAR|nr:hypothetical protein IW261DRAFT_1420743 [Armillaria novae-zelandiae]
MSAYYEKRTREDAWTTLVDELHAQLRAEICFLCPRPGMGMRGRGRRGGRLREALWPPGQNENELWEWLPWDNSYTRCCVAKEVEVWKLDDEKQYSREATNAMDDV